MQGRGYSLWLIPNDRNRDIFSEIIKKIAEKARTPSFAPHITLLGGVLGSEDELRKKTRFLIKEQSEFQISFSGIDYEDYYFRALFVRAELNESLRLLNIRAKEIFGMKDAPSFYTPHLSLLYGDFPLNFKKELTRFAGGIPASLIVQRVDLYRTEGEVIGWQKVEEFPFHFQNTTQNS